MTCALIGFQEVLRGPDGDQAASLLADRGYHLEFQTRAALSVTVDAPFGPVGFTCTHLNWKFNHGAIREKQVAAVCDLALQNRPREGFPPILVGDFNAEPESAEIRYVTGLQSLEGRSVCFLDAWRVAGDGGPGHTWANAKTLEDNPDGWYCYTAIHFQDNRILLGHCAGNSRLGRLNQTQITLVDIDWLYR